MFMNPGPIVKRQSIRISLGSFYLLGSLPHIDCISKSSADRISRMLWDCASGKAADFRRIPLCPASPYAVSKIAQEMLGMQYARAEKLPVYFVALFNHTGPRQKETFVCSAFAYQIAIATSQPTPHRIHGWKSYCSA